MSWQRRVLRAALAGALLGFGLVGLTRWLGGSSAVGTEWWAPAALIALSLLAVTVGRRIKERRSHRGQSMRKSE